MMNDDYKRLPSKVILWGGTGQAKVVRPIIEYYGARIAAVFDDTVNLQPPFPDVELFCGWEGFQRWIKGQRPGEIGFCIAIGNPHGRVRLRLHDQLVEQGLKPVTIVHPTACIADNAIVGTGSQILAGAIVASEARIGRQCIINSHSLVEHETILDDSVEIAPSATVLGLTHIGVNSFVGAGATVLSRLNIGSDAMIGAGTVVSTNMSNGEKLFGSTPRIL